MKPGWIRLSLHPTMTDSELLFITECHKTGCKNAQEWSKDYYYDMHTNEFYHNRDRDGSLAVLSKWFELET